MLLDANDSDIGLLLHWQVPEFGKQVPNSSEHLSQTPSQLSPAITELKHKQSPVTIESVVTTSVLQVAKLKGSPISSQHLPTPESLLQTEPSLPTEHNKLQRSPPTSGLKQSQINLWQTPLSAVLPRVAND